MSHEKVAREQSHWVNSQQAVTAHSSCTRGCRAKLIAAQLRPQNPCIQWLYQLLRYQSLLNTFLLKHMLLCSILKHYTRCSVQPLNRKAWPHGILTRAQLLVWVLSTDVSITHISWLKSSTDRLENTVVYALQGGKKMRLSTSRFLLSELQGLLKSAKHFSSCSAFYVLCCDYYLNSKYLLVARKHYASSPQVASSLLPLFNSLSSVPLAHSLDNVFCTGALEIHNCKWHACDCTFFLLLCKLIKSLRSSLQCKQCKPS